MGAKWVEQAPGVEAKRDLVQEGYQAHPVEQVLLIWLTALRALRFI